MTMAEAILVTGGAGYIGSHCCKQLASMGYLPVCYDDLSTGRRDFVRFGPLVRGDIRDRGQLNDAFRTHRPRTVMHFAARIAVAESVDDPVGYFDVNVGGTITLLEACRTHRVDHIVFSSSAAVYGNPENCPVGLDAPVRPVNPYGVSKAMAEEILKASAPAADIGVTIFRYFNTAGACPDGDLGMRIDGASHLIPNVLIAADRGSEVPIYGTDYPTSDGTGVRDYIHVDDVAAAHVAALRHGPRRGETRTYNLGLGHGYSVREVIASVERVTGIRISAKTCPRRPGDSDALVAGDTDFARKDLRWTPAHEEIDDLVCDAWRWYRVERKRPGP